MARGPAFQVLAAAMLLAFAAIGAARGVPISKGHRRPFGLGEFSGVPAGAARLLRDAGFRGNLLNEMRFGGYLIWKLAPEHPVFIDGRQVLYPREVFDDYVRLLSHGDDFETVVERRGIECSVLRNPRSPRNPSGWDPFPPLAAALAKDPEWALVGFDDVAVVFVRRGSVNDDVLPEHAFLAVDPFSPDCLAPGADPGAYTEVIAREAARAVERAGEDAFPRIVAAGAVGRAGDAETALRLLREVLDRPEAATAWRQAFEALHELGRWHLKQEQPDDALVYLLECRHRAPTDVDVLNDAGAAYAWRQDFYAAREAWEEAAALDPSNEDVRRNLAQLAPRRSPQARGGAADAELTEDQRAED